MKIMKKIIITLIVIFTLLYFVLPFIYKTYHLSQLNNHSQLIDTSVGIIEYRLKGDKGPVVLFVHGSPGGHDQTMIHSENFRVLTPSRPGYLRTPLSAGKTPLEQAKALKALLDTLRIEQVIIIGASGGGPASMEFAAAYPDSTLGLIALEAVSFSADFSGEDNGLIELSDRAMLFSLLLINILGDEVAVTTMLPNKVNQEKALSSPKNIKTLKDLMWSVWPLSLRRDGFSNDYEQFKQLSLPLSSIKIPTIVIHGDEDINVDLDQAVFTKDNILNAKLHIIKGADHYMSATHSEEIEIIIKDFIKEVTL